MSAPFFCAEKSFLQGFSVQESILSGQSVQPLFTKKGIAYGNDV